MRELREEASVSSIAEEICYLDTSALVKRYVEEPGSESVDAV